MQLHIGIPQNGLSRRARVALVPSRYSAYHTDLVQRLRMSSFRVVGPSGSKTLKLSSSPSFGQLKVAVREAFQLKHEFEILYGFPQSIQLNMDDENLLNSSATYGVLKLRLPAAPPPPAAAAIPAAGPPLGYDPEFWNDLPQEVRDEIMQDQEDDEFGDSADADDEDEGRMADDGRDNSAILAQYAKYMAAMNAAGAAGHNAASSSASATPPAVPAALVQRGGFGARIATLGSSGGTSAATASAIGGGIRPGGAKIGRVKQDEEG